MKRYIGLFAFSRITKSAINGRALLTIIDAAAVVKSQRYEILKS